MSDPEAVEIKGFVSKANALRIADLLSDADLSEISFLPQTSTGEQQYQNSPLTK